MNTKIKASINVLSTAEIEASKNRDTSYEILYSIPGMKLDSLISSILALIFWITSRAFEPGRCLIMMEADGRPSVMEIIL
ncbi:unknown [Parabacteroides sp. CAG:409]|nr:unknown [Parabacteroides sp. CAG:409]